MLRIELPFPPSTNHYWRNVTAGRRTCTLISKRGRQYRDQVIAEVLVQRANRGLSGDLSCVIELEPPSKARRDIDNYGKALLDALSHAGVYGDDSQIKRMQVTMHPPIKGGRVTVIVDQFERAQEPHSDQAAMAANHG